MGANAVDAAPTTDAASRQAVETRDDPEAAGAIEVLDVEVGELQHGRRPWRERVVALGVLPAVAMLLAAGSGYLKWLDSTARDAQVAATQSVRAATEDTTAILSYHADSVERDLTGASDRLTGAFRDSYLRLINEVVIPGAKEKRISAVATVPAAASVSATDKHAVVLVFINQTTTVGDDPPTATASSVRVTLEKVDERWLVSQFEPI